MLRSKFNFSWVFALIALLGYVIISFMGLTYTQIVPLGLSALIALAFAAAVIFLVSIMCKAKATRWLRLGMIGQISIGFIVLVLLLVSSIFFTHFTKMIKEQDVIVSTYTQTIDDARKLDEKYRAYVDERCANYQAKIQNLKVGSSDYNKMIAKPSQLGYTKTQIAKRYYETMKNFLLGDNMDELNEKGQLTFDYDGQEVVLTKDDLLIDVSQKDGYVTGRMDNNSIVHFPGTEDMIGNIYNVKLDECRGFYYMGEIKEDA